MKLLRVVFCCCILLVGCSVVQQPVTLSADQALAQVITQEHTFRTQTDPLSYPDYAKNNTLLPDLSAATLAANNASVTKLYQQLKKIPKQQLSQANQINWAVMAYNLKNELDSYRFNEYYMPLTSESGFHVDISFIGQQVDFKKAQDYQAYLSRLSELPRYFEQQMYWMKQGIASGITQPKVVLAGFEQSIAAYIKKDPKTSVYYQPFITMPSSIDPAEQEKLRARAVQLITKAVYPSYHKYYQFMVNDYRPHARTTIAASALPNGAEYYQNRVDYYTTLKLTANEIHQLGLKEVARIHQQMLKIIQKVGFKGDFASFIKFLRTSPQFYAKTPDELLKDAAYIAKKMDGKLPSLFKTLPRNTYGVAPVPANIAPKYTTGRYSPPARDDQAGSYWVNTYRLDRRPLYVLEALTFHEAVPGHHLQGAIAREMKDVPEFRKNTYISAFGEGWGLYAEFLGIEAGFYQDPYSQFGRLTYEMWRACRLVVDTGMHSEGWSRERAINYLASNTALSMHNVHTEIDRYISWPGQALSYKMGELTIKGLRKKAATVLGEQFDLREFHDQILKNGSMPLTMLTQVINHYIMEKQQKILKTKPAK